MPETAPVIASSDRVGFLIRHVLPSLGLLVVMLGAVRQASLRLSNDDTFFHLRFGDEIRDGWSIWNPDSVTSFGTRDWTPTQWAAQITMSWAEDLGGAAAVAWLAGLMLLTYVLVLYLATRHHGPPLVAAAVTALAFVAGSQGLSARPQVISYVLIVITVSAWLRTREDGRAPWWLVALTWAWASLHGMWIVGPVVGLVASLGISVERRSIAHLRLLLVPVISLIACALTPVGPRLLTEVFVIGSRGKYFGEWGPTTFTDLQPAVFAGLFAVVLLIWLRTGGADWTDALLALLAGGWAIYSARTVPVAAAIIAPVAAAALTRLLPENKERFRWDRRIAWGGWATGLAAIALIAPHTLKVGPDQPAWVTQRLDAMPKNTVVLNEWEWGGYLMWRHADLDFVISGYGDIYTTAELDRNVALTTIKAEWDKELNKLGADYALVKTDSRLGYALVNSEGWQVVQESDDVELLAPPR